MRLTWQGSLVIQTVHPSAISDNNVEGWRIENFAEFGTDFWAPMPWYFRQRETWIDLRARNGLTVETILEPTHPVTAKLLSLLLTCSSNDLAFKC